MASRKVLDWAAFAEPAALGRSSVRAVQLLAMAFLLAALVCAYGAATELSWRVTLRHVGVITDATVLSYPQGLLTSAPEVEFHDLEGVPHQAVLPDGLPAGDGPAVGAPLRIVYDPAVPGHLQVALTGADWLPVQWLVLPASLGLLCAASLASALRLFLAFLAIKGALKEPDPLR